MATLFNKWQHFQQMHISERKRKYRLKTKKPVYTMRYILINLSKYIQTFK